MTDPEQQPRLIAKIDGTIAAGRFTGTTQIVAEPPLRDLGEWEYVLVARLPEQDISRPGAAPLAVSLEGPRLRLDLQIDPDDPRSFDDLVTLDGSDGFSMTLGIVSQGKAHKHVKGMTTVIFEGVKAGAKYTCTIDPGREAAPYKLFADMELKASMLLPESAPRD